MAAPTNRSSVDREPIRIAGCRWRIGPAHNRKSRAASAGSSRGGADSKTGAQLEVQFEPCRSGAKPGSSLGIIARAPRKDLRRGDATKFCSNAYSVARAAATRAPRLALNRPPWTKQQQRCSAAESAQTQWYNQSLSPLRRRPGRVAQPAVPTTSRPTPPATTARCATAKKVALSPAMKLVLDGLRKVQG